MVTVAATAKDIIQIQRFRNKGSQPMTTVADVSRYLDAMAPAQLAESWDNVGLLLGRMDRSVNKVMTCLTLTLPVAQEAIEQGVQLIITHHPILFRGVKQISDSTVEGCLLLDLVEAGIAVYSPHTAFDSAVDGINHWLATEIGLGQIAALRPSGNLDVSGGGRYGTFENPMERTAFLQKLCEITGAKYLEFSWHESTRVQKVAVACGSAAEYLDDAVRAGCDTFVTGEARFHSVLESQARSVNLVLIGHYSSERPAVEWLSERISQCFPGILSFASTADKNPLHLYQSPAAASKNPPS
jgi:dinuclear metal center YbgI/SA1388 family protein